MEEEIAESRVTRSLRKRLNSTDREGSPATSKNGSQTPVKSTLQLGAITELDLTSDSEDTGAKKTLKIVRTRARAASTLTEANIKLHSSPARRLTRRSSGAMEPSTPTPVRRSTRASSITSDDVSVNSNVAIKTRRTINIDKTLKEEDEKLPTSPMSTRSTGMPIEKANQSQQEASPLQTTPTKQEMAENPSSSQSKEITPAPPSSKKNNLSPSLIISKINLTEFLAPDTIVINDSDEKIDVADSSFSITSSVMSNEAIGSKHLEPPDTETKQESEVMINLGEKTPDTKKVSRSVAVHSVSEKSSPAPIYPQTAIAKTTLGLDADVDKSYGTQTLTKQTSKEPEPIPSENESLKSDSKSVETENDERSSPLDQKTPTKKSLESDLAKIDVISQQDLDSKTPTKTSMDTNANKTVGTESDERSPPQLKLKTPTINLLQPDVNKSLGAVEVVISSPKLDKKSSEPDSNKSIGKENDESSSLDLDAEPYASDTTSLKPKTDNLYVSDTENKLQHSQTTLVGTVRTSPILNANEGTPLKKGVSRLSLNSSTPIITASVSPAATKKSKDSSDDKAMNSIETKGFSRSWSQSVVGKAVDFIDLLGRQKEPEEEVIKSKDVDSTFDQTEDEEVPDEKEVVNAFINDEAVEADEDDDDSMDEEMKQYIRDNEIPECDISLGSEDSSADEARDVSVSSMDSFIVSDDQDLDLLDGTGDDLSLEPTVMKEKPLRKSHRIVDTSDEDEVKTQEKCSEADTFDIPIDERPLKAGLSKSFVDTKTPKKIKKLNKSVGHESCVNFNVSDIQSDSFSSFNQLDASVISKDTSVTTVDKSNIASPTKKQTKARLSKSLVEPKFTEKDLKLNKSVDVSLNIFSEAVGKHQSSIKVVKDDKQDLQQPENTSSETAQIEYFASSVPEIIRKRSIKNTDCEVESTPPFAKSPINSVKKKPNYDEIIGRCASFLKNGLESKQEIRLQNKTTIPDDKVQKKKAKKEQKQLAKARRAAALIEIQKQATEKAEKKRLKKEARALNKSKPDAEKGEAVAKAINHGISLLSKKLHKSRPTEVSDVVPDVIKSRKRKLTTSVVEVIAKKPYKSVDNSNAVIKQGQAKRKQEPPAEDLDAEPVSHGTLKKRKLPQVLVCETSEPSILINKNAKATRIEPSDDVNMPPLKKMKKCVPTFSNTENSIPTTIAPKKQKKKLKILLTKPEVNTTPVVVAKPKAFDANVLKIKVLSKSSAGQNEKKPKQKKKKEIFERVTVLPKPKWTASGVFEVSSLSKNNKTDDVLRFSPSTDFVVAPLKPNKVNSGALDFKQRAIFNDSVKRESSKQLLQRKEKQKAYARF